MMTFGAGGTGYEVLMKLVIGEVLVVKIMSWVSWGTGRVTITVVAPVVSDLG